MAITEITNTKYIYDFATLPPECIDVLCSIVFSEEVKQSSSPEIAHAIDFLLKEELIIVINNFKQSNIQSIHPVYSIPADVHIAFCEYCEKEFLTDSEFINN